MVIDQSQRFGEFAERERNVREVVEANEEPSLGIGEDKRYWAHDD